MLINEIGRAEILEGAADEVLRAESREERLRALYRLRRLLFDSMCALEDGLLVLKPELRAVVLDSDGKVQAVYNRLLSAVCRAINNTVGNVKVSAFEDPLYEIGKCTYAYTESLRKATL